MSGVRAALRDAAEGLGADPVRGAIAAGVVLVCAAVLTLLLAVLGGLRARVAAVAGELGAGVLALVGPAEGDPASPHPLSRRAVSWLEANLPGFGVAGVRWETWRDEEGRAVRVAVADPGLADVRGWTVAEGRFPDAQDAAIRAPVMAATDSLARDMGWQVGRLVRVGETRRMLVGTVRAGDGHLPEAEGGGRLALGEGAVLVTADPSAPGAHVDVVFVRVPEGWRAAAGLARARRLTAQPDAGFDGAAWVTASDLADRWRRLGRTVGAAVAGAVALALLLGGTTVSGLWYVLVRERAPEIGLRRAMGGSRQGVAAQFVLEALLLSALGGVAGVGLAIAVLAWWGDRFPIPAGAGPVSILVPIVLALLVGGGASWGPARWAAGVEPADALRLG